MKKRLAQLVLVSLFVVPALVLFGCGGKEESPSAATSTQESAAQEDAEEEGLFEGREARDISEMEPYKEKALENAEAALAVTFDGKEEADLIDELAEDFEESNDYYREGEYKQAQKGYEEILKTYPQHYGANVNLTLALLQQEKNEEALVQAFESLALNPTDDGIPLNVQTAAVACGFTAEDAMEVAGDIVWEMDSSAEINESLEHELAYNRLWDRIETELWKAAHGKGSKKQNGEAYALLLEELTDEVEGPLSDDEDAQALLAYLEAVGEQLGLSEETKSANDSSKKDESKDEAKKDQAKKDEGKEDEAKDKKEATTETAVLDAHEGLPFLIDDNDQYTLVFTGYHMGSKNPVAEFWAYNKTTDKTLDFEMRNVVANGIEIEDFSGGYIYLHPNEQDNAWGCFFGKDDQDKTISLVEGELDDLSCDIVVYDNTESYKNTALKEYSITWKADAASQDHSDLKKKVIDEEGVFSLTVNRILGANDDVVELEYTSSYPNGKELVFDSKDDWKVNGKDAELLGAGAKMEIGNGWHHYIILKAKNTGELGDEPVKTVEGTLIVMDADGKELVAQKVEL